MTSKHQYDISFGLFSTHPTHPIEHSLDYLGMFVAIGLVWAHNWCFIVDVQLCLNQFQVNWRHCVMFFVLHLCIQLFELKINL